MNFKRIIFGTLGLMLGVLSLTRNFAQSPQYLPARDYSKISYELGPYYKDPINKFAIRYPKGWLIDNTGPVFNVKFIDPYYEAFIFVRVIPISEPMPISYSFKDRIESLIKELLKQFPGAGLRYCNFEKFQEDTALRTQILFNAGANRVLVHTLFIYDIDRIIVLSWVSEERLFHTFRPWTESAIGSLILNPQ